MSVPPLGSLSHPEEMAETRRQGLEPTQSDQRPAAERSRMEPETGIVDPQPGSPSPGRSPPINLNRYATKKSLAEGLLDMSLFMSNAVQLKAVLDRGPSSYHYFALVTLLSISLLLQVVIGILLVVMALLNLNEVEKQLRLNQLNNAATALIFITVIINIFITAFGAHEIGLLAAETPL
ncbi:ninjurin-2 [Ovis aries]|uniref:ninjurin-2 n=1 Tax=Ovis aries TaxID=9940 RepID=UPI00100E3043|nr:ninjurin-2 [Ovis aries]